MNNRSLWIRLYDLGGAWAIFLRSSVVRQEDSGMKEDKVFLTNDITHIPMSESLSYIFYDLHCNLRTKAWYFGPCARRFYMTVLPMVAIKKCARESTHVSGRSANYRFNAAWELTPSLFYQQNLVNMPE